MAEAFLEIRLEELFRHVEEALFSSSGEENEIPLDAMRALRIDSARIRESFMSRQREVIETLLARDVSSGVPRRKRRAPEDPEVLKNLRLLDDEQVEVSIAVDVLAAHARTRLASVHRQLLRRLSVLVGFPVSERTNPFGPFRLAGAFAYAIEPLKVDIRARLLLLKTFEVMVVQSLGSLYEKVDRHLTVAGVELPPSDYEDEIDPLASAPGSSIPGGASSASALSMDEAATASSFSNLRVLLHRFGASGTGGGAAGGGPHTPGTSTVVVEVQTNELLRLLSDHQYRVGEQSGTTGPEHPLMMGLTWSDPQSGETRAAKPVDRDAIRLMGLLFEEILNDPSLATPMKALIARLQIPYIKLALIDRSVFDNAEHPARMLLNELALAGIGWIDGATLERDTLYAPLQAAVLDLLRNFEDDPRVFDLALADFGPKLREVARRAGQVELRVKELELGRYKSVVAREAAARLLDRAAEGGELPEALVTFIVDDLFPALTFLHVKHGPEGTLWKGIERRTCDLMRWGRDLAALPGQPLLEEEIPALVEGFEYFLRMSGRGALRTSELKARFLECAHDPAPRCIRWVLMEPKYRCEEIYDDKGFAADESDLDVVDPADTTFRLVDSLERVMPGAWIERSVAGVAQRLKIATIIEPAGLHILVDARGIKREQLSRSRLAAELSSGQTMVLDQGQLVDRALERLMEELQAADVVVPSRIPTEEGAAP